MITTPDIQVSRDNQTWFSIFNTQEMMIYSMLMQNLTLSATVPMFYMRVAPNKDKQEYTGSMAMRVGPGQLAPKAS